MKNYKKQKQYFFALSMPIFAFLVITALLMIQQFGVQYRPNNLSEHRLPASVMVTSDMKKIRAAECLILADTNEPVSASAVKVMGETLEEMSVSYENIDLRKEKFPDLTPYQVIVVTFSDLDIMDENVFVLMDWMKDGGRIMFMATFSYSGVFSAIKNTLGIIDGANEYGEIAEFQIDSDFMLGGKGRTFTIDEPFESRLKYILASDVSVYMRNVGKDNQALIWSRDIGKGRIIVHNHNLIEKYTRGFFAASYTMLFDAFAYPVINTSTFFIDDFPAPVPGGDSSFIQRDYQTSISYFYTNIWFADILELSKRYNIPYTGLIIENYTDDVSSPFEKQMDTTLFSFYGDLLLKNGGEIGYHGYNHIPLALDPYDTKKEFSGYMPWDSADAILESLNELKRFSTSVFPDNEFATYVPPSNILRPEAVDLLRQYFPKIDVIAAVYLPGYAVLEQEFEVADNGAVYFPRILSGYEVDAFMEIAFISEMNLHFVNSHFIHPDDVLDVDRGADKGWEALRTSYENQMKWVDEVAPTIRHLTAAQGASAIERYDNIILDQLWGDNELVLQIQGFYDEAYFMLRWQEGEPKTVQGGTLEKLSDTLYLVHATASEVRIINA